VLLEEMLMGDLLPNLPEPRKRRASRVSLLGGVIGGVVAVAVAAGIRPLLGNLFGPNLDDYQVGTCIDAISFATSAQQTSVPDVVDCSDSAAKARIVSVHNGRRFADAESVCPPPTVSAIELQKRDGGSILLCLVRS
jgi:hypothetical protein